MLLTPSLPSPATINPDADQRHLDTLRRFAWCVLELQNAPPADSLQRLVDLVARQSATARVTLTVHHPRGERFVHRSLVPTAKPLCASCPDCPATGATTTRCSHALDDGATVEISLCRDPQDDGDRHLADALADAVTRVVAARLRWQHGHRLLPAPLCLLSKTQWRICAEMLSTLAEKQIADRMELSPHTLHTHLKAIYRKLNVRSRVELGECLRTALHELMRSAFDVHGASPLCGAAPLTPPPSRPPSHSPALAQPFCSPVSRT